MSCHRIGDGLAEGQGACLAAGAEVVDGKHRGARVPQLAACKLSFSLILILLGREPFRRLCRHLESNEYLTRGPESLAKVFPTWFLTSRAMLILGVWRAEKTF